jgi:hypothetical protein
MTEVTRTADIAANDGQSVTVTGRYAVIGMGRHRLTTRLPDGTTLTGNRVARLVFDDGGYIELGVRPESELDALDGQQVSARGTMVAGPPRQPEYVSQPDSAPTLTDVHKVDPVDKRRS